jgi:hypothetical protein
VSRIGLFHDCVFVSAEQREWGRQGKGSTRGGLVAVCDGVVCGGVCDAMPHGPAAHVLLSSISCSASDSSNSSGNCSSRAARL